MIAVEEHDTNHREQECFHQFQLMSQSAMFFSIFILYFSYLQVTCSWTYQDLRRQTVYQMKRKYYFFLCFVPLWKLTRSSVLRIIIHVVCSFFGTGSLTRLFFQSLWNRELYLVKRHKAKGVFSPVPISSLQLRTLLDSADYRGKKAQRKGPQTERI